MDSNQNYPSVAPVENLNGNSGAQFVITKPRAPRRTSIGGKWSKEEDEQLRSIVHQHGAKNWKKVRRLVVFNAARIFTLDILA